MSTSVIVWEAIKKYSQSEDMVWNLKLGVRGETIINGEWKVYVELQNTVPDDNNSTNITRMVFEHIKTGMTFSETGFVSRIDYIFMEPITEGDIDSVTSSLEQTIGECIEPIRELYVDRYTSTMVELRQRFDIAESELRQKGFVYELGKSEDELNDKLTIILKYRGVSSFLSVSLLSEKYLESITYFIETSMRMLEEIHNTINN